MRKDYLEIINNLKAAVRIGHVDSILAAVGAIENLPEIKSNAPIPGPMLEKLIVPAGETFRSRMVRWETIKHLRRSPLTGTRALMASAAGTRWLLDLYVKKKALRKAALDPRREVRDTLILSLKNADPEAIDPLWKTVKKWLNDESPRVQQTAILLLPLFMPDRKRKIFKLLAAETPNGNPDINAALVEVLTKFGKDSYGNKVVDLLSDWANNEHPNGWVICKTISGSWAVEYRQECESILKSLEPGPTDDRLIDRTYAALKRNAENKM